jgi:iron complex outermembrane receptor protein
MPRPGRIGLVVVCVAIAPVAVAQQEIALDEIVIVGSRGDAREPLESMVPVEVITADEMQMVATNGGELGELLQALEPSFNFPRQSNSSQADHIRAAQLRGLGPDQVLVLVNGKRQHVSAVVQLDSKIGLGTNPFDFNTIPLIAIERIEILRDGAAAQYGSDAIAGVINIVLKSDAEGGSVTAHVGTHDTDSGPGGGSISDGETYSVAADFGFGIGNGGSFRFGGEYRDRSQTNRGGVGALPFFEEQTPANQALDNSRLFAPGDGNSEDVTVFYNTRLPTSGTVEFYSFGHFNTRDAEGAAFFRYPDGFQGVPAVYPNGFRPVTTGENEDLSIAAGLTGEAATFEYDVSVVYGVNDYDFGVYNSINPSFGAASPTAFELGGFEFTQATLNLDIVRQYENALAGGAVTFAFGAEYRAEDYQTEAGDPLSYEAGPDAATKNVGAEAGPGLDIASVVDVDRTVFAIYGDLELPLTDAFTLGIAARYEDYDDFGDATTGKVSGRYAFTEQFAVRATWGTNFRAPSLAQTGFASFTQTFGAGGMLETFGHLPVSDPLAIANGALPLVEEEAENLSVGFVFSTGSAFSLTADYFRVDIDDRLSIVPGSTDNVTFFTNLVDTKTDGFDIQAQGVFDAGAGTISWLVAYNNSETEVKNPTVIGEEELNTLETAAPDDKFIASGSWDLNNWFLTLRATRFGETTRDFDFGGGFPDPQTYDAVWSLDAEVAFSITDAWLVAIGGDNLFDEYPDESNGDINFFGHLPYDVLSPIGMNGRYWYARTSFNF